MRLANNYFMQKWPDPTIDIVTDKTRPSNLWTRAMYYEGLMALHGVDPDSAQKTRYYNYAVAWGASPGHPWQVTYGDTTTRNGDNQCCGQTYIDLYKIDSQAVRVRDIKTCIDGMVNSSASGDWTWIDAIQMAMPVFAKLGVLYNDSAYFEKMHALYANTRNTQGLYNSTDRLWWRDSTFKPPYTTPNGKQCYWSRGNGWVFAALSRVMDTIPSNAAYRAEYQADFTAMAGALSAIQRADGFWNVSLADTNDYPGPELTGTALFTYGMAWGIRQGLLDANVYGPVVTKAWCALVSAVHTNGFLGYAQGTGSKPSDGQPVTFDSTPNFEDYPVGCFLLAGSEVWKLASS
jgi:rhamnogalacturonyl hydrolase YesR